MAPRVAIIVWSAYGHILKLAETEQAGIEAAGGKADIFRIPDVAGLRQSHVDSAVPEIKDPQDMTNYDAFLFGIPTRYGNFPATWKAFMDNTAGLWATGGLAGKYFGLFVSSATMGGGQESTAIASLSTFVHHGMTFVPLGYKHTFAIFSDLSEVRGGSPWGAGTFAGGDGSRQPSAKELEVAKIQGQTFYEHVSRVNFA